VATSLVKRRQQVLKPRGSPDIDTTLKPLPSTSQGQHWRNHHWRGTVGSAGVVDRSKGTGWVAWEPERPHSRPRARARRPSGSPAEQWSWPGNGTSTRSGALAAASTKLRGNRVGPGSEPN